MQELKPARLDEAQEARSYRNKFPWKWVALGAFVLACVVGGYQLKKHRDAGIVRTRIMQVHEHQLHSRSQQIEALERKIEGFVMDAVSTVPVTTADERLDVNQLRRGHGLYLRLPASAITSASRVEDGARVMGTDAIMNCMGLAPVSARTLYEKGAFLDPAWTHQARDTSDVLRLRVIEEDLLHHIRTDLPVVESAMQSDWFMLALERGTTRTNGPVDIYLWNLRDGEQLLKVRTQAAGALITARATFGGAPAAPAATTPVSRAEVAADCSIASQVRAATGTPAVTVQNAPEAPLPVATPTSTPATR
ncbi:MAG: hypothetical protein IPK60_10755 [Sandaracinaceae bacterium]|nr:hypothetical protein [Sandaracinaceae bacterium]